MQNLVQHGFLLITLKISWLRFLTLHENILMEMVWVLLILKRPIIGISNGIEILQTRKLRLRMEQNELMDFFC